MMTTRTTTTPTTPTPTLPAIDALAAKVGGTWTHIRDAAEASVHERARLATITAPFTSDDASFVAFGSLARGEFTAGSDLDWTLLVDGRAAREHREAVRKLSQALTEASVRKPGPSGVFGNLAFSHPILHQIGGQDDSNRNTTQRILLLLESEALGEVAAHGRLVELILDRYISEDKGLVHNRRGAPLVTRVLLNDISRYWRTLTIDFLQKQGERDDGWALRNIKLRLSRKLIFMSGLIACFSLELHGEREAFLADDKVDPLRIVPFLRKQLRKAPLESLAEVCLRPDVRPETSRALFDTYDAFLGTLGDPERRGALKRCQQDDLGKSEVFRDMSRLARRFQEEGVKRLFFEDDPTLRDLTVDYGVF